METMRPHQLDDFLVQARAPLKRLVPLLLAVLAGATSPDTVVLSGRITGASGKHTVRVALWDQAGFLEHPVRELRFEPGADLSFRFEVAPGRWALSAFEDRNENGKLDMGVFGPKEPSGFWRPFHAWRRPKFEDVAQPVEQDTGDANIRLQ
jgi:uncharacterized protein (DUF2141 family)